MAAPRQLAHPPIVEALIDIRGAASVALEPASFEALYEKLKEAYPLRQERHRFDGQVRFQQTAAEFQNWAGKFDGMFYKSADEKQIAQFRLDGFTLNRLKPYTDGDSMLAEARRLWNYHLELAQPTEVTRVGMRYINQFSLPLEDGTELGDYLTTPPAVPKGLPDRIGEFLTRVAIGDVDATVVAVVTQKLTHVDGAPVITIDVEVSRSGSFHKGADELMAHLVALRQYKNRAFFSLLTDLTLGRFDDYASS